MTELDDHIEYLDEDAETVLQCLQKPAPLTSSSKPLQQVERSTRLQIQRKKRTRDDDDSDYNPEENKLLVQKKARNSQSHFPQPNIKKILNTPARDKLYNRKKMRIRIPDYDDPLCLPVRALRSQESDLKRLSNWNNVCLEHFKYCDQILKPENGATKKSVRNAVFKNVVSKHTGSVETTIWSKTSVESEEGEKKSEIFQCILPRYKEKKTINNFIMGTRRGKSTKSLFEAVLTKEMHKDGEALVVYKPKESTSAIYKLIDKRNDEENDSEQGPERDPTRCLTERTCARVCGACYQASDRGLGKLDQQKTLVCPICGGTFVSLYNLLSHFKAHSAFDIRRYKKGIAAILSHVVGYHYKCRVCRQQFDTIKGLRRHIPQHGGSEIFECEVGNHIVNNNYRL